MTKMVSFEIPDAEHDALTLYASQAGLDIEAFVRQSASYFMRMDVLGVREAEMKMMEIETRKTELLSRQKKAAGVEKKAGDLTVSQPKEKTPEPGVTPQAVVAQGAVVSPEDMNEFVDSSVSSSDLESHVTVD